MTDEELIAKLRDNAQKAHEVALHAWGSDFLQGLGAEARIESVAADRLRSLLTQNQKMREALEPFANYATDFDMDGRYDNAEIFIRIGPCRIARALLHGTALATPADEAEPLPKATI